MADAQRVVELIFRGVDQTAAATQAVLTNMRSVSGSVGDVTGPMREFTSAAVKFEAGILAAGAAVVTFAVKTAGDFDAAFRQISTLFDASDAEIAGFRDAILRYASTSTASLEDITNSISAAVGSGVAYGKSLELIGTAERLAVATRADLKGTTEVLVSTLNAYGMATDKAGAVSDLFFKIIADGKIEMGDLSQYLANITPIAATAGVSLQEIGAAVATLTAAGIQPSTAIDALRSAISNIIKPSEQATKLAAELGIQFDANALKSKGFAGVLTDVQTATGGSADKMAKLFGDVQGLSAVMTLTGAQASTFKESLVSMGNAAGSVDIAFGKMAGSIEQAGAKAANAFKVLLVEIGSPLMDEFGGIANAIASIFNALGASVKGGALKDLVAYIEGIFGDIEATMARVAKNLPAALESADLSGFRNGIQAVIDAVRLLFGGLDLTSAAGLAKAIEGVGAAFLGLSKYTAGVIESMKPVFDLLVRVGQGAAEANPEIFKFAGTIGGIASQIDIALPALNALLGILIVKEGAGLVGAMRAAAAAAPGLIAALGSAGLVGAAGAAGYAIGTALNDPLNKLASSLTGSQTTLGAWAYDLVNGAERIEGIGITVDGVRISLDQLNQGVESGRLVWNDATGAWTNAARAAKPLADGLDGVAGAVSKITTGPITEYVNAFGTVVRRTIESREALDGWNAAMLASGGVVEKAGAGIDKFGNSITASKLLIDKATGAVVGFQGAFDELSKADQERIQNIDRQAQGFGTVGAAASKTAEEMKKAEEATRRWNEEVAKMQHAEKLKLIEASTQITTAQIEADTKRMSAAFESVNMSIANTGETLTSMLGLLGKDNLGLQEWRTLTREIEKESTRRDAAFKLQEELTKAQISMMKAQTDAMMKGEGMIKIDGAGLQPHLEAFMWEILRSIQVRVNNDGLKMLLGV